MRLHATWPHRHRRYRVLDRRPLLIGAAALVLVAAVISVTLAIAGDDDPEQPAAGGNTEPTATGDPVPPSDGSDDSGADAPALLVDSVQREQTSEATNSLAIMNPMSSEAEWSYPLPDDARYTVSPTVERVVVFAPGDAVTAPTAAVIDLMTQAEETIEIPRFPAFGAEDVEASWAPDGRYLAFTEEDGNATHVIDLEGAKVSNSISAQSMTGDTGQIWGEDQPVSWSADGAHLLTCDGETGEIVLASADGSHQEHRADGCQWVWAQDGSAIGIVDNKPVQMNPTSGKTTTIPDVPAAPDAAYWEIIPCRANDERGHDAVIENSANGVYALADGGAEKIAPDPTTARCDAVFSADGQRWAEINQDGDVVEVGEVGSTAEPIQANQPGTAVDDVAWAGDQLLFSSEESLFAVNADGDNGQQLDISPVSDQSAIHYVSDLDRLLVGLGSETSTSVEEVAILDGEFQEIGRVPIDQSIIADPYVSPDGRYLTSAEDAGGTHRTAIVDVDDATLHELGEGQPLGWVGSELAATSGS